MTATKQALWMFVILISLACSGWYFASLPVMMKLDANTLLTTTDMFINELTVRQFDTEGRLVNYLHTPFMRHVPSNNAHWLKKPHILVHQKNQSPWEIHAHHAISRHGGEEITFHEHVIAHQAKDDHTEESTFTTELITYYPKEKRATTPLKVTFKRPGHAIEATGMTAYLAEKRVDLLSQARGTYEPPHDG